MITCGRSGIGAAITEAGKALEQTLELPQTPSFRLDGNIALVTGAGRGLGLAFSAALASAGAHVVAVARTTSAIGNLVSAIRKTGGSAESITLDVTDTEAVRRTIAEASPIDILVNNAGINRPKPVIEVSEEDYDAVSDLNMRVVFFLTQAVVRRLVAEKRGGSIINISSQMGHVGLGNRTLYCSTKHAMEGFTKALAVELAPYGIRANTIAPTFIETPMTQPILADPAFRADALRRIPIGRFGQPEELMSSLLYLASDSSSLVTGTSLRVDGGYTAA